MRFIESVLSDISHYMKHLLSVRFIILSLIREIETSTTSNRITTAQKLI